MTTQATGSQEPAQAGGTQPTALTSSPAEVAPAASSAPEAAKPAEPAAPAAEIVYDFKAPEGIELDKTALDSFTALAKELKLPADKAQAAVNLVAEMRQREADAHAEQVANWAEALKTDKEFGGEKFNANCAVAKKAIDTYASPELKAVLTKTGLGNHPEMVRFAFKVGQLLSEDTPIAGASTSAAPSDTEAAMAARMYPKTPA